MIGVKAKGRLGNQMFQYAFAIAAAQKLSTRFVYLSSREDQVILGRYFTLRSFEFLRHAINKLVWLTTYTFRSCTTRDFTNPVDVRAVYDELFDHSLIYGYFQSADYFADVSGRIREYYSIKQKYKKEFWSKYSRLNTKKYIAVHVRRTDYQSFGDESMGGAGLCLPDSYYYHCLSKIKNIQNYELFFVSDDPEYVKNNFNSFLNLHFDTNSEIVDFQLLMNADILIISHSSFSWWAAFLNKKPKKIVFAPKYWLGYKVSKEIPIGIMNVPFNWIDTMSAR